MWVNSADNSWITHYFVVEKLVHNRDLDVEKLKFDELAVENSPTYPQAMQNLSTIFRDL